MDVTNKFRIVMIDSRRRDDSEAIVGGPIRDGPSPVAAFGSVAIIVPDCMGRRPLRFHSFLSRMGPPIRAVGGAKMEPAIGGVAALPC